MSFDGGHVVFDNNEFNNNRLNSSSGSSSYYWWHPYDWHGWQNPSPRCAYCDGIGHSKKPQLCPRVKSISYYEDGSIAKVRFYKMEE